MALSALRSVGFEGLVCVELSRDSFRADVMIGQARQQLTAYEEQLVSASGTAALVSR